MKIVLDASEVKASVDAWLLTQPHYMKSAIELWIVAQGYKVSDSDNFILNTDGTVEIDLVGKAIPPLQPAPIVPVPSPASPASPATTAGNFDKAFAWVIKWEGSSYEDVPGDSGGPTKYGIDTTSDASDLPPGVALKDLTLDQAKAIYLKKYWLGSLCDKMPTPVAETHFNYAVNTGASQSVKFMQKALGVTVDGQYGPLTASALLNAPAKSIALGMVDASDAFYKELATKPNDAQFLKGWENRNADLRTFINSLT